MVILVVRLWYEHDSQLFDTEAAETDGNQMPFIACLYHLCVPITSVMKTTGTAWHEGAGIGGRGVSFFISKAPQALTSKPNALT